MRKFEIGKEYTMRSICDHDCVWSFVVTARTAQTITIKEIDGKIEKRCRISKNSSEFNKAETIHPLGKYSMCPSLVA